MQTRLTDVLGIEHPVMLAGMGGVSYSALVAAVSEAGGFGCFGASTMSSDEMVDEIRAAKALTDEAARRRPPHRAARPPDDRRRAADPRGRDACSPPGSACRAT